MNHAPSTNVAFALQCRGVILKERSSSDSAEKAR